MKLIPCLRRGSGRQAQPLPIKCVPGKIRSALYKEGE